jgi:hypothetical protein
MAARPSPGDIKFEAMGIAKALASKQLSVPVYQRDYSWSGEEVDDLFHDLNAAINDGTYFLGAIVLKRINGSRFEVVDGQQRLATVSILLAAIRDYFHEQANDLLNVEYLHTFLSTIDPHARARIPRLTLNVDDDLFFRSFVFSLPGDQGRSMTPNRDSHRLLQRACKLAKKHVQSITAGRSESDKTAILLRWVEFLNDGVQVILLTAPDSQNAFKMFETLNWRGAEMETTDLLKNYLFSQVGDDKIRDATHLWSAMTGTLESVGVDELVITYLRHLLVSRHGAIRDREVYDKISATVKGSFPAMEFIGDLEKNAATYTALLNHKHPYWNSLGNYAAKVRKHVETINELRNAQIRPLMLACLKEFGHRDVEAAFRIFIHWTVRLMVAGLPTGTVEKYYAGRAAEVWRKEITSLQDLVAAMQRHLPDDAAFQSSFATIRVSKSHLARYYLRSLQQAAKDDPEPEWVVNDDPTQLTLEHVLPERPSAAWGVTEDHAARLHRRLGNMVLLKLSVNTRIGNESFQVKKLAYKASSHLSLTKQVLKCDSWGGGRNQSAADETR